MYIELCPKLGFSGHHGVITIYLYTLISHYSIEIFQYQLNIQVNIRKYIYKANSFSIGNV